jgi:hypothetical protein
MLSAEGLFRAGPPAWFRAIEQITGVSTTQRHVAAEWRTSPHGCDQACRSHGTRVSIWETTSRRPSAVYTTSRAADTSVLSEEFRSRQQVYAINNGITYESISDGTGGALRASFAWQITVDLTRRRSPLYREIGWGAGLLRSDTAELAGLLRQLAMAPDQAGVRLCSDCNGVLLMITRARSMTRTRLLRHTHRALLIEWLDLEGARTHGPVELGWVRGHTTRTVIPFDAQRWCDEMAPSGSTVAGDDHMISTHEGRFVLIDGNNHPVRSSWKDAISRAGVKMMAAAMHLDTRPDARGEVQWHRARGAFLSEGWDNTAMIGKTGQVARLRLNAEADTITDALGERWTSEAQAREEGNLANLARHCACCSTTYHGGWATHAVGDCTANEDLWTTADAIAAQGWAEEAAWDYGDASALMARHAEAWAHLSEGGLWHGFELQYRQIGKAPDAKGVAAEDHDDGTTAPAVMNPEDVHGRATDWAARHPEEAAERQSAAHWQMHAPVVCAIVATDCTLIPAKLFEMWESWQGPEDAFETAVITCCRRDKEAHADATAAAGGVDDYWTWIALLFYDQYNT